MSPIKGFWTFKLLFGVIISLILITPLFFSGCTGGTGATLVGGGGAPPPPPPPPPPPVPTTTVSGTVSSSVKGPPVSGATVTLLTTSSQAPTGLQATTNGAGQFAITGVTAGTYDAVATKAGDASARYQSISVDGTTPVSNVNVTLFPFSGVGSAGTAPIITLGAGTPGPNAAVSGNRAFAITVAPNPSPIYAILLRVGGNKVGSTSAPTNSLNQNVNFGTFPPGQVAVGILAQDAAHNTALLQYNVTNGTTAGAAPAASFIVSPLAQTFGQDLQLLRNNRQAFWTKYHLPGNPNLLYVPGKRTINLSTLRNAKPSSTAPGTTISVTVTIDKTGGSSPAGYNIYRATSAVGPFTLLGSIPSTGCTPSGAPAQCDDGDFTDFDPNLAPGTSYYYQAAPYNSAGEGTHSPASPPPVTILGAFHVLLDSPGGTGGSTQATTPNTSTSPSLQWHATSIVGTEQVYDPLVFSETNNFTSSFICGGNTLATNGSPIVVVKNGLVVSPTPAGVIAANGGANLAFPYSAFSKPSVTPFPCTTPLLGGAIYEWDSVESIAQGSENPPGSGNFLSISIGNGQAYTGRESLTSGSDNGAFFFTTTP